MPRLSSDVQTTATKKVSECKEIGNHTQKKSYLVTKRALDILISFVGLIVMFVPMVVIAVLIKLESQGPAIYIHNRIGKNGKALPLLKFRSMVMNADDMIDSFTPKQKKEWEESFKLAEDPRVTRLGKFLRKSSIDELPQLINVLKGELSIVGPRPVVEEELERYGEDKTKFLSVTPGLTGYWQAYARSTCSYEKRMEMELFYAENANLWWDIKIILVTFHRVITGIGAQ